MNRRFFTPAFFIALFVFSVSVVSAQDDSLYYAKARQFLIQAKTDSAEFYLNKALAISPDNLEMLEDDVYIQFLKRDFAKAIAIGKSLAARPDAGIKTFQLIGMTYKEIADYKEAKKNYDQAITRFPHVGVLYSELGDMFASMNKKADAIATWEKGIEMDPGYSGNYYYAALFYAENSNPLWAILYAENFVNIESLSNRTIEIKNLLTDLYKKISAPGYLITKNNPFALAVAATFSKQPPLPINNFSVESLTSLRMAFIKDWYQENSNRFPYKLFEYQDQLVKQGLFDAYNQWLLGTAINASAYTAWMDANKEKMTAFRQFVGGRVYKIPQGQYYQSK